MKKALVIIYLFALVLVDLPGQDDQLRLINSRSAGVLVEYGSPYYYLPEGQRYYPLLVGGTFSFPIYRTSKNFNLSIDLFPHYGFVWLDDDNSNYEFGLGVRLGFNFSLSPNDLLSMKLGSGPHYITVNTEKQASGFIFSDYYLVCYDRLFYIGKEPFALELEFGYRHISNAGLTEPNRSISNFIFGLGTSWVF